MPALIILLAILTIIIVAARGIAKQIKKNNSLDQQQLNKNIVDTHMRRVK
jgi:hypothetical protein